LAFEGQPPVPAITLRVDDPCGDHVSALLAFHIADLRSVMGEQAFALDAEGLSAPSVTFWTAWHDLRLVGFGALKRLSSSEGEVKSMRAASDARGMGVGRAILDHIIREARSVGLARLSLETGTAKLHAPAVSLYRSAGFESCKAFGDYAPSPQNQFMRLEL
jgi:putative acetyltransferase